MADIQLYTDPEALFRGLTTGLRAYGKCSQPAAAVFRVNFDVTHNTEVTGEPEWILTASLTGFGELDSSEPKSLDPDVAPSLDSLQPEALKTEAFEAKGQTILEAGEGIRKQLLSRLEAVLFLRQQEVSAANQAKMELISGVLGTNSLWGDPARIEAAMEILVEEAGNQ